jgi:hypothetical protein
MHRNSAKHPASTSFSTRRDGATVTGGFGSAHAIDVTSAPRPRKTDRHQYDQSVAVPVFAYALPMVRDHGCVSVGGIAAIFFLAGCAGQESDNPLGFAFAGASNPSVIDADACGSAQDCAARLKTLVTNPNRDWIGVPQSADGYANGTRLFAYRTLRRKLTCSELQRAVEDCKAAMTSLDAPPYSRARALAAEVTRELATEQAKRCSRPS